MTRWLRWTLAALAPIVGIFASIMSREWREDILGSFPFAWGSGPISSRAVAFWALVSVPVVSMMWQLYATHRDKRREHDTQARLDEIEKGHAQAVALSLSQTDGEFWLWSNNRGTHVVRDVEINAIPDDEDWHESSHGPLPELVPSGVSGVKIVYPILGGWFMGTVEQLAPDRGLALVKWRLRDGDFTKIDVDISWHDHEGRRRKSHGIVDLRSQKAVDLRPRPDPRYSLPDGPLSSS